MNAPVDFYSIQLSNGKIMNLDDLFTANEEDVQEYIESVPKRMQGQYFALSNGQTNQPIRLPQNAKYILGLANMKNDVAAFFNCSMQVQFIEKNEQDPDNPFVETCLLYVDFNYMNITPGLVVGGTRYFQTLIRPVNPNVMINVSFNNISNFSINPFHLILIYI